MRIAHVTGVRSDGLNGGIERHVLNLATAQKARGDAPLVVVPEPGALTEACTEYGIPVAVEAGLAGATTRQALSADPQTKRTIENLCSLFAKSGTEIIHSHTRAAGAKTITAGNRIRVPCIFTDHELRISSPYDDLNLRFAAIVVCRSVFELLRRKIPPEETLYYIPNGTKAQGHITRHKLVTSRPHPELMSVGRQVFSKGLDILILAMAELKRRRGSDCPALNIYGEGSLEGELKEMVLVLRLDNRVRFHGAKPGILEVCPATDVLVVSSRIETGPLVALEAMSRGMPIVATSVGDIPEMIPDQRYGHVVKAGSIIALADGIESMLADVYAGRFDPDLSIERHRRLFTVEKMADCMDAAYKDWIAREATERQ